MRHGLLRSSVRLPRCRRSCDRRRCATCVTLAALAVCGQSRHGSSIQCCRAPGGSAGCRRRWEVAVSCGAASSGDTTSSSPVSRGSAREARRSGSRILGSGGRRASTSCGRPGPFRSPGLDKPVDRQACQACRPSRSRSPPRQTRRALVSRAERLRGNRTVPSWRLVVHTSVARTWACHLHARSQSTHLQRE
jgi:hypothetical protein